MADILFGAQALGEWLWAGPMALLMLGVGLFLTLRLRGQPLRSLGTCLRETLGRAFRSRGKREKGAVTPFQALCTALAGSIGTGNIAGVTAAITLGGPGALFWLWVTAALGMTTKFAEVVLALRHRRREPGGGWSGGPMDYIKRGLGRMGTPLAWLFCLFGSLAAFAMGNAVQAGNIAQAVGTALNCFSPGLDGPGLRLALGLGLAVLVAVVMLGGAGRLGSVCELLVPVMSAIYLLGCGVVILGHLPALPGVLRDILVGAFRPEAVMGGAVGISLRQTMIWGLRRGLFSHEAGLGSAPMAHACSQERDPVRQGLYGVCEVFIDTVVVCTATGLCLLCSGVDLGYGTLGGLDLNVAALATVFGRGTGAYFLAVAMALFAFSSILSWGLYGSRCWSYLTGGRGLRGYRLLFSAMVVIGVGMELDLAWALADLLNALMALPNLLALLLLSGQVAAAVRGRFGRRKLRQTLAPAGRE